jgi:thiol-disulfide isomerase/thioredoxin
MGPTGRRREGVVRALRGALEGAVIVGLGSLFGAMFSQQGLALALPLALIGAGLGALMFGTGRAVAGKVGGAALLGVAGLVAGAYCGERVLGRYAYQVPAVVQPGQEIEIAGPTLQGPPFDLRHLRGKVVLVDFWATWCGPCVAGLPHLREVYDRYHARGFEVVGVSLDFQRDNLAEYVKDKQIPWPQIFFDEEGKRGWANPLARRYGIHAIPDMILVDADGRVVPSPVPGDLESAVARLVEEGEARPAGEGPRMRTEYFPMGLLVGALAGCFAGSLGGALAERAIRRPKQGPPVPPATGQPGPPDDRLRLPPDERLRREDFR